MIKFALVGDNLNKNNFANFNDKTNWDIKEVSRLLTDEQEVSFDSSSSIINTIAMMKNSVDEKYNPVIVPNIVFYNSETDVLEYKINGLKNKSDKSFERISLNLFDSNGTYGSPKNIFSWTSEIKPDIMKVVNEVGSLNAIVSEVIAKRMNLKVGDIATFSDEERNNEVDIKIKVVGINSNDYHSRNIFVDYNAFMTDSNLILNSEKYTEPPIAFTDSYSQTKNYSGKINIDDTSAMLNTIKITEPYVGYVIQNDSSVFSSYLGLDKYIKDNSEALPELVNLFSDEIKFGDYRSVNDFNFNSIGKGWDSISIEKKFVKAGMGFYQTVILIFIVLNVMLLILLLFVVINSIIDDLKNIILMLKSVGYKTSIINFAICGNYLIWSAVSFIFGYLLSLLLYWVVTKLLWSHSNILIGVDTGWQTPVITMLITFTIIAVAFNTSLYRILKLTVSSITREN